MRGEEPIFRALQADEVDQSYNLYQQVRDWLEKENIKQWLSALPKEEFQQRQMRGELFGLFVGDELAVIIAITHHVLSYWQDEIGTAPEWWLGTIATAPSFRGRRLGEQAIAKAVDWIGTRKARNIYLDCARGFLPGFYQRCGFSLIMAKDVTFPSGNTYPLVLMKKGVSDA